MLTQTGGLPSGAMFPVGVTTNSFTATDADGNTAQSSFDVIVTDTQSPNGGAPANVLVNADLNSCNAANVVLGTPAATDNCGIASITNDAPPSFPVGTTNVTWIATDVHGNISTAVQTVIVVDNQKPTIAGLANISANAANGSCTANVSLGTPVTADNCGVASVTNNAPNAFLWALLVWNGSLLMFMVMYQQQLKL